MSRDLLIHFNPDLPAAKGADGNGKKQALKKACQEFESIFVEQLLSVMRKAVPKSDLMGNRSEEEMYTSLYDQEISVELTKQKGLGLAAMMYEQLSERLPGGSDTGKKVVPEPGKDVSSANGSREADAAQNSLAKVKKIR